MKRWGIKFWEALALCLAALVVVCVAPAIWIGYHLSLAEKEFLIQLGRQHFEFVLIVPLLLLLVCGWAADLIFRNYIRPIKKIAEEVALIHTTNPSHRIQTGGGAEIQRLCLKINEGAERHESLKNTIADKIRFAKAETEQEKNILAAVMAELPEGVLICNPDNQIILFNNRAKQLLSAPPGNEPIQNDGVEEVVRYMGLGRSVFGIIDKNLIQHAIDEINNKLGRQEPEVVSYFVFAGRNDKLLRVEAVPILNAQRQYSGLILILYDITRQLESNGTFNLSLQSFTRGIRASLAGIRSAIETIIEYPQMDLHQLEELKSIIHKESLVMGEILENNLALNAKSGFNQWPLMIMSAKNLTELLQAKALEKMNIRIQIDNFDQALGVKIDSYSFLLVLLFVIDKLQNITGTREFICRLTELDWFIGLDLLWQGPPVKIETLREWEQQPLAIEQEGMSLTLREIIDHHTADIGSYSSKQLADTSYLRFFLPAADVSEPEATRSLTILPESRPEFYDFDLFSRPEQFVELESRLLTELTYTVFDMETTGLDPAGGDEIVAIGAFRIVNCRLLSEEHFEQLVDPQRPIPWTSVQIHGIHPEMLIEQPIINKVLPRFHRFVEDTILVAHNAAFDMRFLQMKEAETGVRFMNPVLDTLLLSAVVHPAHENHNLEAIASRLGVRIIGRHTASGDALATGELFLKMLPLLAQKDIYTLKDALSASQKTHYARMKF
jgi:DNA polymerase-3 subunit epsilon